jgi:hypothetical protein
VGKFWPRRWEITVDFWLVDSFCAVREEDSRTGGTSSRTGGSVGPAGWLAPVVTAAAAVDDHTSAVIFSRAGLVGPLPFDRLRCRVARAFVLRLDHPLQIGRLIHSPMKMNDFPRALAVAEQAGVQCCSSFDSALALFRLILKIIFGS